MGRTGGWWERGMGSDGVMLHISSSVGETENDVEFPRGSCANGGIPSRMVESRELTELEASPCD